MPFQSLVLQFSITSNPMPKLDHPYQPGVGRLAIGANIQNYKGL